MRSKTTGHLRWRIAIASALALSVFAGSAGAAEVELTTSNDIVSGEDDLYTAELGLGFGWGDGHALRLGERIFTDRERGVRFDESFAEVGFALPAARGWDIELGVGALHVGEGLGGESLQNEVHRAVGSDPVRLAYPEHDRWFPTAALTAQRTFPLRGKLALAARGELELAPGFRNRAHAELIAERPLGHDLAVLAGAGVLANDVETRLLGDRVRELEPTVRAGVAYRGFALEWGYSLYGTATGHATIAYRAGLGGRPGRGR